ncbi:hypothetical protein [Kocuria nitroreducens]|uniref:hypothetical protein n=1 Tax=Kocuria nitroreducens TaxID=3058914 RepID=UPI0036DA77BF
MVAAAEDDGGMTVITRAVDAEWEVFHRRVVEGLPVGGHDRPRIGEPVDRHRLAALLVDEATDHEAQAHQHERDAPQGKEE